ncbi:extracellular matrix-binding protein ebh isoform X10 [Bactrocera dorsalis]|uniref:Extracellular matrix-binding protein ebh isoform X10 n=1 Tax=Bactrocera dorsalis TaxID=27457 RepID=A0ABM3JI54_BACDO|nr:extracellular matrix-binding protein ebh isoform X10 [Bactrocera dorsalis]
MPPKRRRRFQGLYYHSSPPKVLPMNGQSSNQGRKRRDIDDFSVKLSTIRIWMHEKDIGKLTRILWAGQGSRLCQQASTNPRVKRFLAAVPYVMNSIKDVHQAVIDNNLETLQAKMESPVPPALITCRDANGLNLIHKAAGLGHTKILEYLIGIWPDGAAETDITGKTPLHWAASHKNNMRCYTLLTEAGCDEEALDYKMKSPTYYRHKPHEIERAFLVYVPEAPRVSPDVATDWEALSEDIGDGGKKLDIKIPDTNGFHGRTTDDSIENTSEVDLNDGVSATDEEPQAAAITNGNGDDSAPQTPAEDDGEAANDEEDGEEEPALTNGATETSDVNGHDAAEAEDETEDTKAAEVAGEAAVDTDAEAEAPADVDADADIKGDVEADAQANPEVEATEAETNMKALNHTTTTKTNGNEEHAEQKESEAVATAVDDSKDMAESEIVENETKSEESGETEKVEDRKEESEEITNEESEPNVREKDEEKPKTAEVVDNTEDETKESESNEKEKDEMKDEEKPKTAEKKEDNTVEETKENEVKENEIESETTNTEGKIEETKISELSTEPRIESGDTKEHKEQVQIGETEEKQTEAEEKTETEAGAKAEATNGDKKDNQVDEVQQAEDHKNDEEVNKLEENVNNVVDETATADTTEAVKDIVKEQKHEHENENEAATDSENDTNNGYESDNEPAVDTASEHEAASEADENDDEVQVVTEPQPADKLDENHNEAKYDSGDGASSPTSSLAIEGFVTGASEDNRVQSQSAAYVHEQSDIREAIEAGDMEQLAQIVLNGDGKKLVNMRSHNPDIQAFLSNVPNYMSKIRRVHEAAREGSLLALQQALDRRKFAIAKDDISPNGATPLHVAVLFGNTDIVRYLAARFPETTTITDNDGRTALHYAATINDNGHFYNVLTQLGANSKALDKLGHTPEFYQNKDEAKDILNYKQLLSNFGAEELEDELLNDQGQAENASSQMNPIFKTEQGKYLANNLADPLIKALTEIANKRPEDPVAFLANYLQNYLHQRDPTETSNSGKTNSTATITSHTGMVRRTGTGLRSANNINGDADRIDEDHISNADEDEETQANVDDRDEHGQSMLHFACARSHRRGALMHLIEESNVDITYRDELYRTARDVSLQANQPSNAKDIDRYVLSLAVIGDVKPFEILAVEGYDHIVDITDDNELSIVDIAVERGHEELANFLRNLRTLEELREELHQMIRDGNVGRAKEIVAEPNGKWLLKAKNYYGRTALHIAVLKENEEVVEHFVNIYPDALKIGDNLERTVLHYAMGTNAIESLSRILIQKGAKRTTKDLKGRQPSYYFMNKADILRLQEEEEENR